MNVCLVSPQNWVYLRSLLGGWIEILQGLKLFVPWKFCWPSFPHRTILQASRYWLESLLLGVICAVATKMSIIMINCPMSFHDKKHCCLVEGVNKEVRAFAEGLAIVVQCLFLFQDFLCTFCRTRQVEVFGLSGQFFLPY